MQPAKDSHENFEVHIVNFNKTVLLFYEQIDDDPWPYLKVYFT